ncbi:isochorismatase family protein [Streptomyces rectiverticillatus]|uniref:isochorismatase family protein n=1 Tax=Streptomyces rectiverticillatus TaxID=173860 RepID=UPI0015C40599|nr:isochorismatase family protein [Streptomyces rectiverticillatus]QLE73362.1 isochorismatase family protein [Streptomyces rectiverticillatus]
MATTTLRALNGFDETPAALADATLVMIDYQNTYTAGVMELDGWKPALESAAALLAAARRAGATVIHVQEAGYDIDSEAGRIHPSVSPVEGEAVVVKTAPDAFHKTDLGELVDAAGNAAIVIAGFMTHMCVMFTAQGAFLRGSKPTIVADACATRPLQTMHQAGRTLTAQQIHDSALATVSDLYGVVVPSHTDLR